MHKTGGALLAAIALGCSAPQAVAQSAGDRSIERLERELARRDAAIAALETRVRALEGAAGSTSPADVSSTSASTSAHPRPPSPRPEGPSDSDDDLLSRALERSLVMSGGLVVPSGAVELEPSVQVSYARRSGLALLDNSLGNRDVRTTTAIMGLRLRAGLPWQSQVEVSVPYAHQGVDTVFGGVPSDRSRNGFGDLQLGLSRQLLTERGGWPGLIANVTYQRSSNGVPAVLANRSAGFVAGLPSLGAGYDAWLTTLTAVKRTDPVVFVGSLSRAFNRATEVDGITVQPSDTTTASLRAVLAASPNTSLRGGFWVSNSGDTRVAGVYVPGTKQSAALLELGASYALSRRTLIDVTLGVGLTPDAPDYVFGVSVPFRF